jgi:hypothetical protein
VSVQHELPPDEYHCLVIRSPFRQAYPASSRLGIALHKRLHTHSTFDTEQVD